MQILYLKNDLRKALSISLLRQMTFENIKIVDISRCEITTFFSIMQMF